MLALPNWRATIISKDSGKQQQIGQDNAKRIKKWYQEEGNLHQYQAQETQLVDI